jgi:hypothetical protein
MLTKEQILSRMRGFDCPKYLTESCWQPIYDQCVAAIALAAENERLKAELDAIRKLCVNSNGLEWTWFDQILEIIDKDGDTDA